MGRARWADSGLSALGMLGGCGLVLAGFLGVVQVETSVKTGGGRRVQQSFESRGFSLGVLTGFWVGELSARFWIFC